MTPDNESSPPDNRNTAPPLAGDMISLVRIALMVYAIVALIAYSISFWPDYLLWLAK